MGQVRRLVVPAARVEPAGLGEQPRAEALEGAVVGVEGRAVILGSYYLTHDGSEDKMSVDVKGSGKMFSDMDEMIMAYQSGEVGIHAKVSHFINHRIADHPYGITYSFFLDRFRQLQPSFLR